MNARILCPGPSLAAYEPDDFGGPIIGINRAATAYACDWWACIDLETVLANAKQVKGKPGLLTNHATAQSLPHFAEIRLIESLFDAWPRTPAAYSIYSATSGAVLAAALGATVIDVYGCDLAGTLDWDGTAAGKWRTDDRWKSERELWMLLRDVLAGRGVTLNFQTNL